MTARTAVELPAGRYDRVAQRSAGCVIAGYSTSFGWATRLLDEPVRTHVRSIYALVRIADETVDDPDPTFAAAERSRLLEDLAAETARAVAGARDDHGAHGGVAGDLRAQVDEPGRHLQRDEVQRRVVQRELCHAVVADGQRRQARRGVVVGHGLTPPHGWRTCPHACRCGCSRSSTR